MLTNPAQQVLAFGGCRCPNGLEVGGRPASELHIGVQATAVSVGVEVEERLVPQVEVRAVVGATRHVHEPIGGTKSFDELRVCHPTFIADLVGLAFGQRSTRPATAMPVRLVIATRHQMMFLGGSAGVVQAHIAGSGAGSTAP
jgi:hypothetical protein